MHNKYSILSEEAQAITKAAKEKRREEKMCGNKTAYSTKELAFQKGQTIYKCEYCNKWHRSSQLDRLLKTLKNVNPLSGKKKKKRKSRKKVIKINGKKIIVRKRH